MQMQNLNIWITTLYLLSLKVLEPLPDLPITVIQNQEEEMFFGFIDQKRLQNGLKEVRA